MCFKLCRASTLSWSVLALTPFEVLDPHVKRLYDNLLVRSHASDLCNVSDKAVLV